MTNQTPRSKTQNGTAPVAARTVEVGRFLGPWSLVIGYWSLVIGISAGLPASGQSFLDRLDDALVLRSSNGWFRADLSGLVDLEGYYIDQRPPGLIFPDDRFFFNPRLALFLDTRVGSHFYSLVQFRADRGFDPGLKRDGDVRLDEYFLRYTPFDDPRLNWQVGKFATVIGNWVARHQPWNNPFITAPVPYENVTTITDHTAPPSPAAFLARRNLPDKKNLWLPVVWGPSYTSGASVFGRVERFDYAVEVKNAPIASRPAVWDATRLNWEHPTFSGRLGIRPNAAWNLGVSASHGAYLLPAVTLRLPVSTGINDFNQTTLAGDLGYAHRRWQVWAEMFLSRFAVPTVGNADTLAYYLEAKYKITPSFFGALRWNQQWFGDVPDGMGGEQPWDHDLWRVDAALGWRWDRHVQAKLQYSYSHQRGVLQQGQQLIATQLTVRF